MSLTYQPFAKISALDQFVSEDNQRQVSDASQALEQTAGMGAWKWALLAAGAVALLSSWVKLRR
jgi:hypothetical protein